MAKKKKIQEEEYLEDYVDNLSKKVFDDISSKAKNESYSIDPLTLLTIASILLQLIKIIMEWYNNRKDKAADSIKSLNFIKRAILWKAVKKECKKSGKEAEFVYDGLINLVSNLSSEERYKLFSLERKKFIVERKKHEQ